VQDVEELARKVKDVIASRFVAEVE
jgi:hypothetical protein